MVSTCEATLHKRDSGAGAMERPATETRVLIMSGSAADAQFLTHMARIVSHGELSIETVDRLAFGAERLCQGRFDAVLLDLKLLDSTGLESFARLSSFVPRIPVVVVVGMEDEELAQEAVRRGAQDYLIREQVTPHTLAHSLKCAIERQRQLLELRDLSMTDPLTGLLNRRGFWALADSHLRMTRRQRKRSLILCADLDGLKEINDTQGHDEGDRAIVQTAELLLSCFRDSDIVARFGGDEFVALAYDTDEGAETTLRNRISRRLAGANSSGNRSYELSVSIGTVVVTGTEEDGLTGLLRRADRALYREKQRKSTARRSASAFKARPSRLSRRSAADLLTLVHSTH